MFGLHEKVVYPGHGVAEIIRFIERKIAGKATKFFELKFLNKDMTILVPVDNIESVGIRRLSTPKNISNILKILAEPINDTSNDVAINWNKRNKEYQGKIRTGNLRDICYIYRDLKHIESHKELSFGEKNLLHQTEMLLVEEIALVHNVEEEKATKQIRTLVSTILQQPSIAEKNL